MSVLKSGTFLLTDLNSRRGMSRLAANSSASLSTLLSDTYSEDDEWDLRDCMRASTCHGIAAWPISWLIENLTLRSFSLPCLVL